jgi:hypothetical protein
MTDDSTPEPTDAEEESRLETRIVEVGAMPDPALLKGLRTGRERLTAIERHFHPKKEMILERLKDVDGVSVKDLSSSNTMLVTAPESAWATLEGEGGLLDLEDVRVHKNTKLTRDDPGGSE